MLGTRPELRLRLAHMNALFALCLLAVQPAALWCRSLDVRAQTPSPHSSESESESWESPEVEPQAPIGAHTRNNIAELLLPLIERGLSSERRPAHSKKVIQVLPLRSKASKERQPWPHLNPRKKHVVEITPLRSKGRDGKPLAYILSPAKSEMRRNYPKRTDRHHADHEHKDHTGHHGWKTKKPPSESSSTEEASVEENDNITTEEDPVTNEITGVTSEASEPDVSSEESNDVSKDKGISISEEAYDDSLSVVSSPSDETNTRSRSDNDYTKSTTSESEDSTQNKQESDYTSTSSLNSDSGEDDRKGTTPPFLFSESDSQDTVDEKNSPENNNLRQFPSNTDNSKQTSEGSESQNKSEDESKSVTDEGSIEKTLSDEDKTETEEKSTGSTIAPEKKNTRSSTEKIETTTIQDEIRIKPDNHSHENNRIHSYEEGNEIIVKSDGKANNSQPIAERSNNNNDDQGSEDTDQNEPKKEVSQTMDPKEGFSHEEINDKEEKIVQPADENTKDTDSKSKNSESDPSLKRKETSKNGTEDHSKDEEESKTKDGKDGKSMEETVDSTKDEHVGDAKSDQSKKKTTVTPQGVNTKVRTQGVEPTKESKLADSKGAIDEKHYKIHHDIHHSSNQRNLYKEHSEYLRTTHNYSDTGTAEKPKKNDKKEDVTRRKKVTTIYPDSNDSISIASSEDRSGDKPSEAAENPKKNDKKEDLTRRKKVTTIHPDSNNSISIGSSEDKSGDKLSDAAEKPVKNDKKEELTRRKKVTTIHPDSNDSISSGSSEDKSGGKPSDANEYILDKNHPEVIGPNITSRRQDNGDSNLENGISKNIQFDEDKALDKSPNHLRDKAIITDKLDTSTAHDLNRVDKNESTEANKSDQIKHKDLIKTNQSESLINNNHTDQNISKDIVRNVQSIDDITSPVASMSTSILRSDDIAHLKSYISELQLSTPVTPGYQRNDIVITQPDHLNKFWEPRSRDIIELIQTSEGVERVTPAQCEPHDDKQNDHAHEHKSYRLSFLFNK